MRIDSASALQGFPFSEAEVFEAVLAVLPAAGFTVKSNDRLIGRIVADASASLFSWGEKVSIQVQAAGEGRAEVSIQSGQKFGVNLTTAKNDQNAERIIGAVSHYLQNKSKDPKQSAAAAPSNATSPLVLVVALLLGAFIILPILLL